MDLFFWLSKAFWVVANPGNLLIFILIIALLMGWRMLTALTVSMLTVLVFYPLGHLLLQPLESRFAGPEQMPQEIAGIIVLGGGEEAELSAYWNSPQFNSSADRIMSILPLIRQYPDAPVIVTGGSGSVLKPDFRGADVVQSWMAAQGLEGRLIYERDSRNTFENAIYSADVLPEGADIADQKGWLLVTSAFHMPRSVSIYRKQGWQVIPYPTDYYSKPLSLSEPKTGLGGNLRLLSLGVREWLGLTAYYFTDKTDSWFPSEQAP
ncbi:MAG: YdcF family protein [Amphritea sp.]|nr:YdcF family protein [Amphritea sp.]